MRKAGFHPVRGLAGMLWHMVMLFLRAERPDPCTGRGAFVDVLTDMLTANRRLSQAAAALIFEVDDFRKIEETHDRDTTDVVLEGIAHKIADLLGPDDRLVQLHGARFGIALSPERRLDLEAAIQLATRIQHTMADPLPMENGQMHVTVSVGFALASRLDRPTAKQLLRAASIAQFEALRDGPNAIRSYSAEMHNRITTHNGLIGEVQAALQKREITAHFQPQIDLVTGQLSGVEALARWRHPLRGLIAPADFLPVLEQNGLMGQLGHLMLSDALRAMCDWDRQGLFVPQVSINMSNAELRNPYLVDHILMELDKYKLAPGRLVIEVLETVVGSGMENIIEKNLSRLAAAGCGIDLDDFGTGHASITTIRKYAIQRIKIDRSFVTNINRDTEQQNMVAAILTMAERLDLVTLAEGVETPQEQDMLSEMGCRHMQGFALARPASFADITRWIENFEPVQIWEVERRATR